MPCKKIDGAEVGEWTQDYDAAVALAKAKDATVIVNFTGSDWCGWCKIMDKNVFHNDKFPPIAKTLNLVLVYIDFPSDKSLVPGKYTERNNTLKGKFGVGGYPTYIVLDSDLKKLGKLGAGREKTPESFGKEIESILRMLPANLAKKEASLGGRAAEFKAAMVAQAAAKKELDDWLSTKPTRNPENEKKFKAFNEKIAAAESAFAAFYM